MNTKPTLEVLICTYGKDGIRRTAAMGLPHVEGVEYLVSWQDPDNSADIPEELIRPDIRVCRSVSKGLSHNRNLALSAAHGEICLIADDDLIYTAGQLLNIIHAYHSHPEADIITFRFESETEKRVYPSHSFNLDSPPKGYFITSFEIAFRLDKVLASGVMFDERFGIGAPFIAGEEDIFVHELLRHGLKGIFLPQTIATHNHATTSTREAGNPDIVRTKGAVFTIIHPRSWPLRMLAHAGREKIFTPRKYISLWIEGVRTLKKLSSSQNPT